jgi:hypothetical protein
MDEQERPIIEFGTYGNDICSGCGGHTVEGELTGNTNIRHFLLHTGRNSTTIITYCNECAAKIAHFLLHAWE